MSHIAPHFHEVDAFLWFTDNGLSPYWALSNLCVGEFDGYRKITYEIGDEVWTARINYNAETGIAPRDSDPIQSEKAYEFKIHAEGPDEQKADFVFSPRWDDQRKPDGDEMSRPWCGGEGVQAHVQGSNLTYDEYLFILQYTLQAFADEAETDFSRRYFGRPRGDSNIVTTELYVRLMREYATKLTRSTGVFYRIMHLLAEEKDSQFVYKGDNTDIVGKRHAFALDPYSSSKLVDDHSLGKRLKSYHPKYVRSKESQDDPLSSPKFGVAFHKSLNTTEGITGEYRSGGSAVKWRDRDQLLRELEETLINVLRWAGIPIDADPTAFVEDYHFRVEESERSIGYFDDPTPRLDAEQENLVMTVLQDLSPSARSVMKTLATDGGEVHYGAVADETGYSVSQVYRALDEIGDAVVNDNGLVRFFSKKIRQEITAIVERIESFVEDGISAVARLANVETRSSADSAIQRWMSKYGASFENVDEDGGKLRFDTVLAEVKSYGAPVIDDVLEEGLTAWKRAGRNPRVFAELRFAAKEIIGRGRNDGIVGREITW